MSQTCTESGIFQVHTIAEQRVGMAKGAGAKRGDAARGADQVRAEFHFSKFNELSRESLGGVLEAREAAERESHVQNELCQPETTAAPDFSRRVRQEREQFVNDRAFWAQYNKFRVQKEHDTVDGRCAKCSSAGGVAERKFDANVAWLAILRFSEIASDKRAGRNHLEHNPDELFVKHLCNEQRVHC